ncbi:MAG: hypothetical protein H0U16_06090 [Actinobacteria bacterium]|nr:hypothetical protein [Actinomycetota bacterium]
MKKKSDSPVKVSEGTKERIRIAAAVRGCSQADILDAAVNEYIDRHTEEFATGLKRAGEALFEGREAEVAYLISMSGH